MIFGIPAWMIFCGAAVLTTAAFFYRRRLNVVEVPAVALWREIGEPVEFRSIARNLRSLLSLAIQVAIIALGASALALSARTRPSRGRIVLVVDEGFTMQTREPSGRTRFELAREQAQRLLDATRSDVKVMLVGAAHRPVPQSPGEVSPADASLELQQMHAMDVESDLSAALTAAGFVQNDPSATVVVISDFAAKQPQLLRSSWNGSRAALSLVSVGSDQPDAAIINSWTEAKRFGWQFTAVVDSRGLKGKPFDAQLISRGKVRGQSKGNFSGQPQNVVLNADLAPGDPYQIILNSNDALAADDDCFGVVPANGISVCLVSNGDPTMIDAIKANPNARLTVVPPRQFKDPKGANVVIVDGVNIDSPLAMHAGWLFVAAGDPQHLIVLKPQPTDVSRATQWSADHPVLADIQPDVLPVPRVFRIDSSSKPGYSPIVSSGTTPLIIERPPAPTQPRCVYWLFNPEDGSLPDRLEFPLLLWNTLDYLAFRSEAMIPAQQTGHPLTVEAQSVLSLLDASKHPVATLRAGQQVMAKNITTRGFYTLTTTSGTRTIPVNLYSTNGLSPGPGAPEGSNEIRVPVPDVRQLRASWQVLLGGALILCTVEWILYQRRVVRVA